MENVMMISRHRQWRAWQFGVRHGGLWRNSGGTSDDDEPKWTGVVTAVGFVVIAWWLFGWPAGVALIVIAALLFALCVWLSRRDKKDDG